MYILHVSVCDPGFHAFCIPQTNAKWMKTRVTDVKMNGLSLIDSLFKNTSTFGPPLTQQMRLHDS